MTGRNKDILNLDKDLSLQIQECQKTPRRIRLKQNKTTKHPNTSQSNWGKPKIRERSLGSIQWKTSCYKQKANNSNNWISHQKLWRPENSGTIFCLKISFLTNPYTQQGASIYSPWVKNCILHWLGQPGSPTIEQDFLKCSNRRNIKPGFHVQQKYLSGRRW